MSSIKEGTKVLIITISLFFLVDFATTWLYGARGFSLFFVSDDIEGRHNKPGFSGGFGGPLSEFNGQVNIGNSGERLSNPATCKNALSKVLFIGDSTTAGFEVDDKETFISLFNNQCVTTKMSGTNFGVRAHDSHAVIGTYKRVSSSFPHNYVVYLMTPNDFEENLQPRTYENMTKRFGRRFEGRVIKPVDDQIWHAYAALRLFVSDKLTFTTAAIRQIEHQLKGSPTAAQETRTNIDNQVQKAFELIHQLSDMVSANGAELVIIPYPKLNSNIDSERIKTKLLSELITKNLEEVFYIDKVDSLVAEKVQLDGRELPEMRFKYDGHLSKYGHKIISEVLLDIFEDLNTSTN